MAGAGARQPGDVTPTALPDHLGVEGTMFAERAIQCDEFPKRCEIPWRSRRHENGEARLDIYRAPADQT